MRPLIIILALSLVMNIRAIGCYILCDMIGWLPDILNNKLSVTLNVNYTINGIHLNGERYLFRQLS